MPAKKHFDLPPRNHPDYLRLYHQKRKLDNPLLVKKEQDNTKEWQKKNRNAGIGMLGDSPELLKKAIKYLE